MRQKRVGFHSWSGYMFSRRQESESLCLLKTDFPPILTKVPVLSPYQSSKSLKPSFFPTPSTKSFCSPNVPFRTLLFISHQLEKRRKKIPTIFPNREKD